MIDSDKTKARTFTWPQQNPLLARPKADDSRSLRPWFLTISSVTTAGRAGPLMMSAVVLGGAPGAFWPVMAVSSDLGEFGDLVALRAMGHGTWPWAGGTYRQR